MHGTSLATDDSVRSSTPADRLCDSSRSPTAAPSPPSATYFASPDLEMGVRHCVSCPRRGNDAYSILIHASPQLAALARVKATSDARLARGAAFSDTSLRKCGDLALSPLHWCAWFEEGNGHRRD